MKTLRNLIFALVAISLFAGCAQANNQTYVVEYQVIGDRSVKYLVTPYETSMAGQLFLDQSVGLEVCSVASPENAPAATAESQTLESRCRTSRILRTQEYR